MKSEDQRMPCGGFETYGGLGPLAVARVSIASKAECESLLTYLDKLLALALVYLLNKLVTLHSRCLATSDCSESYPLGHSPSALEPRSHK